MSNENSILWLFLGKITGYCKTGPTLLPGNHQGAERSHPLFSTVSTLGPFSPRPLPALPTTHLVPSLPLLEFVLPDLRLCWTELTPGPSEEREENP